MYGEFNSDFITTSTNTFDYMKRDNNGHNQHN